MTNVDKERYEVCEHGHGRPVVKRGPMEGVLDWPQHRWYRLNQRGLGLKKAVALAESHPYHAVVVIWQTSEKVFDNNKPPLIPEGWYPIFATVAS